jgi:uncharacterized protein (TIGR02284 family)
MNNEKTIEVLNKLVEINNDRVSGYETAYKETEELDLKSIFHDLSNTSHQCKNELSIAISKLGGSPTEDTKVVGKFFRVWMDVKAALTGKDRKAILNSCEYGEDMAKETYEDVLENDIEHLNDQLQSIVKEQYVLLVADHDRVKMLRDAA